jgi:hypothetical protein
LYVEWEERENLYVSVFTFSLYVIFSICVLKCVLTTLSCCGRRERKSLSQIHVPSHSIWLLISYVLCDMFSNFICWTKKGVHVASFHLNRCNTIYLNISHSVALSANEILIIKYGCICICVHWAHRFQPFLKHRTTLAMSTNFPVFYNNNNNKT